MKTLESCLLLASLVALSNAQGYGCTGNGMDDAARDVFLNTHNDARRSMAMGKEIGLSGGKNVYKLSWSCDFESKAASYIATCPGDLPSTPGTAVNLQLKYGSHSATPMNEVKSILTGWWSEAKSKPLGPDNKYPGGSHYQFANMANGIATAIGCAYKLCHKNRNPYSKLVVACYYNAIGFYKDGIIYEKGTACAADRECTTYPGSTCSSGLCVKGSSQPTPAPVQPKPVPVTLPVVPGPSTSKPVQPIAPHPVQPVAPPAVPVATVQPPTTRDRHLKLR